MTIKEQNKMKKTALLMAALALGLAGCTYYLPHQMAASNVPINPPSYEVVGPAAGESCRSLLLTIIPVGGSNRLQAAIDAALKKSGGDALIEVTSDYKVLYVYPFFAQHCTLVNGLAIKRQQGR
ncbi:MAG: hypothetical protein NTY77_10435 [Elusimicrobia bacterium]|nr:hypothetical protein [Elusimicrobiota bacterium]